MELIGRVRTGEQAAYGFLVERYQRMLYRHARGLGLDHDTSLDLVQDAFVRAFTRLTECRDPEHFRAWLFRICRNLCLDHLKNIRRRSVPFESVPDSLLATHSRDVESRQTLCAALNALPDALREAFLLKHDAGYTYDEVAQIMETSPSAAKMRVHRARHMLADWLGGRDEMPPVGDDLRVADRLYQ